MSHFIRKSSQESEIPGENHNPETEADDQSEQPVFREASPVPTQQSKETFLDLLTQDISWNVVKKVMQYEIPSMFSGRQADLGDAELHEDWMTAEDLVELAKNKNMVEGQMGAILVSKGYLTDEQLESAQIHMRRTGQPLWRTLLQLRLVSFQQMLRLYRQEIPSGSLPDNRFIQWLQKEKKLSREKLAGAWEEAKRRKVQFSDFLVAEKICRDEDLAQARAFQMKLPYDDLRGLSKVPESVIRRLPLNIPIMYNGIPVRFRNKTLRIAFSSYEDILEFGRLGLMLDYELQPVFAPRKKVTQLIQKFMADFSEELQDVSQPLGNELEQEIQLSGYEDALTTIMRGLIERDGTDIHIEPQKHSYRIRYRVDGLLHDIMTLDLHSARRIINQAKALGNLDLSNTFTPQDGHINIVILSEARNFRASILPTPFGEKVVLRLVKPDYAFSRLDQLGMSLPQRKLMDEILNLPAGLILTAGPVGSGKTTTLYACLNCMNLFTQNVTTIEDPVEYELPGATQAQVNPKRNLTFASGLRSILRQDPDVIMVGEIRDDETAAIAVRASMTGQKVLSTIHANSATNAITSLLLSNIRPVLVANALVGLVFQRLVRKVCRECAQTHPLDVATRRQLGFRANQRITGSSGKGCPSCLYTGYHGQTCVYEILRINEEMRTAIAADPSQSNLDRTARTAGLLALRSHAADLVKNHVISPDEALRIL